jgi:hypothetical protein
MVKRRSFVVWKCFAVRAYKALVGQIGKTWIIISVFGQEGIDPRIMSTWGSQQSAFFDFHRAQRSAFSVR